MKRKTEASRARIAMLDVEGDGPAVVGMLEAFVGRGVNAQRAVDALPVRGRASETKQERLKEIRRRLGPYTAVQGNNEPFRLCDAEIARRVAELVEIVTELVDELE